MSVCQVVHFLHVSSYILKLFLYYILLGLSNYDVNKVSHQYHVSYFSLLGCTLAWAVRYLLHPIKAQVQSQGRSYRSYGFFFQVHGSVHRCNNLNKNAN